MRKFLFGVIVGFCAVMAFGAVAAAEEPPEDCTTGVLNELGECEPVGNEPNPEDGQPVDSPLGPIDGPAVVDLPEMPYLPFPYDCPHGQDPVTYECYPEPATTGVSDTAASHTPQSLPETGAEHWYMALIGTACLWSGIALCCLATKK